MAEAKCKTNPWLISTVALSGIIFGYLLGMATSLPIGFEVSNAPEIPKIQLTLSAADKYTGVLGTSRNAKGEPVLGNPDATVTLVEYSDFECPFCSRFFQGAMSEIETNYVATGKVNVIFKHYPLPFHSNATLASEAAACANEQNKFWPFHDALFLNQTLWAGKSDAKSVFYQIAEELKLNKKTFQTCLDTGAQKDLVNSELAEGQALGVRGTPTLIANGFPIVGAQSFPAFEEAIEKALLGEKPEKTLKQLADEEEATAQPQR